MKRSFRSTGRVCTTVFALALGACASHGSADPPDPPAKAAHHLTDSAVLGVAALPQSGLIVWNVLRDGPFLELQHAARQMPALANGLSTATAQQNGLAGGVERPAERLRGQLTQLLREHLYLTGAISAAAVRGDPLVRDGRRALELNGESLLRVLVPLYGADAALQFQGIWRQQAEFFAAYTTAALTQDQAGKQQAMLGLDDFTQQLGQFLTDTTHGALAATTAQQLLAMHVTHVEAAIDAQVAGEAMVAAAMTELGATHLDAVADTLAGAFAQQLGLVGDAGSLAGELRARLTALLTGHVFLTVAVADAAIHGRQAEFDAWSGQLGLNGQALTQLMTSVLGEVSGAEFDRQWSGNLGTFLAYARAVADDDVTAQARAQRRLAAHVSDFSTFLAAATGELFSREDAAADLAAYVDTLTVAIDAQAPVGNALPAPPDFGHFPPN